LGEEAKGFLNVWRREREGEKERRGEERWK
jgi:hypothetical protein